MYDFEIAYEKSLLGAIYRWGTIKPVRNEIEALTAEDFPNLDIFFEDIKKNDFDIKKLLSSPISAENKKLFEEIYRDEYATIDMIPDMVVTQKERARKERLLRFLREQTLFHSSDLNEEALKKYVNDNSSAGWLSDPFADNKKCIDDFYRGMSYKPETVLTGYGDIDYLTGGFRLGTFAIIGAYASTGKTTFALNIVHRAISKGVKTLMFSLEMNKEMIYERQVGILSGLNLYKISNRILSDDDKRRLSGATSQLKDKLFAVVDNVYNVENIAVMVRKTAPKLVIVDFIQCVRANQKFNTDKSRIDYISTELKRIAKENNCCLIGLSQVARDGKNRPTMSSLKESGNLEADGDYVIILYRDYVSDKSNTDSEKILNVLLDKNKFGRCGEFKYRFDTATQRIEKEDDAHG